MKTFTNTAPVSPATGRMYVELNTEAHPNAVPIISVPGDAVGKVGNYTDQQGRTCVCFDRLDTHTTMFLRYGYDRAQVAQWAAALAEIQHASDYGARISPAYMRELLDKQHSPIQNIEQ